MVARCTCTDINRHMTLIFNILFMLFGCIMDLLGIMGLVIASQFAEHAVILNTLNFKDISAIILITGVGMNCASVCGFVGALKKKALFLKIFIFILFLACLIQLAMGIYMKTIGLGGIDEQWFEETDKGYIQRVEFQDYYKCCGWYSSTDSLAPPQSTACPLAYSSTCYEAAQDLLDEKVSPVANCLLAFSLIEIISLASAGMIIAQSEAKTVYIGDDDDDNHF